MPLSLTHFRFGSIAPVWLLADHFRSTSENGHHQCWSACLKGADIVAKVFLGWRTKIFRAAEAFCARRRGGPYRVIQNRSRTPAVRWKATPQQRSPKISFFARFLGLFDFRLLQQ